MKAAMNKHTVAKRFAPKTATIVTVTFAIVTVVLLIDPWPVEVPYGSPTHVPDSALSLETVRNADRPLGFQVADMRLNCSECHEHLAAPDKAARELTQHRDIVMAHGLSNRCYNCHHREKRDYFVDHDGSTIDATDTVLLCRKCHGPVYRDWLHRVHGRTNGYWDRSRGEQRIQPCIACHDPHAPAFQPMAPAPGPWSSHKGNQSRSHQKAEGETNPLRYWRRSEDRNRANGDKTSAYGADRGAQGGGE